MKYNETSSNGLGDIEQIRKSSINHMTRHCDLDLESVQPSHSFCTFSHSEEYFGEVK